jgi:hypothetical protein
MGKGVHIQGVLEGKVNILGGHSIAHSKKKEVYMCMCPILNGFRDKAMDVTAHIMVRQDVFRRATCDVLT